jgi:hypothetical protein
LIQRADCFQGKPGDEDLRVYFDEDRIRLMKRSQLSENGAVAEFDGFTCDLSNRTFSTLAHTYYVSGHFEYLNGQWIAIIDRIIHRKIRF